MTNFDKVGTFMKTFGQEVRTKPSFSTDKINKLRLDLIKEELSELTEAMIEIARTGTYEKPQIPSIGCSIKWKTS